MAEQQQPQQPLPSSPGDNDSDTTSYTASLVQSAAKSLLDTSVVSDGDDGKQHGAPSLASLQIETQPALPDEQDRKKFVGCLAAILASSYDYDFSDENEDPDLAESSKFLETYIKEEDDDYAEGFNEEDLRKSMDMSEADSAVQDSEQQGHQTLNDGLGNEVESSRRFSRAESSGVDSQGTDIFSQTTSTHSMNRQDSLGGSSHAPKKKSAMFELRRDFKARKLALRRHRQRRYQVMSELLVNAGEFLGLEKSQSRAFVPLLAKLLNPPKQPDEEQKPRSKVNMWGKRPSTEDAAERTAEEMDTTSSVATESLTTENSSDIVNESNDSTRDEIPAMLSNELNDAKFSQSDIPLTVESAEDENDDDDEDDTESSDKDLFVKELDEENFLRPFLESLSPGSGFRCLAMLLLEHLLRSPQGYDARVRHVYKKLGVIVLLYEMEKESEALDNDVPWTKLEMAEFATRKFESLEHGLAARILTLSAAQSGKSKRGRTLKKSKSKGGITREQVIRGIKIGSAGIVAGTLFAVTGGLAAPGIAAGLATLAGSSAATATIVALTSTAAISSIFGVSGAGLAAYKMHRRQAGLTEFEFQKESGTDHTEEGEEGYTQIEAELFTVVCMSGWLRDERDFQRPWGITPWNPPIQNQQELLERFYAIFKPDNIPRCAKILNNWKGEEERLWTVLEEKYGKDPDHLFPLEEGPRHTAKLTLDQEELLDKLFVELSYAPAPEEQEEKQRARGWRQRFRGAPKNMNIPSPSAQPTNEETKPDDKPAKAQPVLDAITSNKNETSVAKLDDESKAVPNHVKTVWDYQATYGGELYTVRWESSMILELCNSVEDLAMDIVANTTSQLLKQTAFAALITAIAVPAILFKLTSLIDGTWTIAIERSDAAGKELAKSLLFSKAGHRPVTLVGYSMGARAIYSCLKELAKYQEKWEAAREERANNGGKPPKGSKSKRKSDDDITNMREPASVVEDVILMGMPNHLSKNSWIACRQVVAGRLVNCYSRKDMILTLMFQYNRLRGALKPVCGTTPVRVPGVENVDVSSLVSGHQQYCFVAGEILRKVRHGQPIRGPETSRVHAS